MTPVFSNGKLVALVWAGSFVDQTGATQFADGTLSLVP
jgi:hypothetical protein